MSRRPGAPVTGALWYAGRGAGVVAFVLLSGVLVLGIVTWSARPLPGLPRFAVVALHRSIALLAVVFVAVHALTLRLDPYAALSWLDLVLPTGRTLHPVGYGLGAVALDLIAAVVVTSLVRTRLSPRWWRRIHGLSYVLWVVALVHIVLSGTDTGTTWLVGTLLVAGIAVVVAAGSRWLAEEGIRRYAAARCRLRAAGRAGDDDDGEGGAARRREPGLPAHRDRHGSPAPLILDDLRASGLTGRGGAGFPLWRKLEAAADTSRWRSPVVVANGAEGEPASSKDRALMLRAPHLVLDGLALAADLIGASRTVAYVRADALGAVRTAAEERRRARLPEPPVRVVAARPGFVAGEETAVLAALEGRAPRPADKARRITERGLDGRPTVVSNVETLAHLAVIGLAGVPAFRARGTDTEPGTVLATVHDRHGRRVVELQHGVPLTEVLDEEQDRPVLVGGYHGAWLAPDEVRDGSLSRAALHPHGATPGAGVLLELPAGTCVLRRVHLLVRFVCGV